MLRVFHRLKRDVVVSPSDGEGRERLNYHMTLTRSLGSWLTADIMCHLIMVMVMVLVLIATCHGFKYPP
jgi:hypothetical protein